MSIALMSAAFKARIKATPKLVLLALCDCANDQGECYPSVPTLMEKCSAGERTVQDAVAFLEKQGFLNREFRTGRSTVYWIADPRTWRTPAQSAPPQIAHPTPAVAAPPPPQQPHPTPAVAAPITIIEPSVEPSMNQNTPKPPRGRKVSSAAFDAFWSAYPRKVAKDKALSAFDALAPSADLLDELLSALAVQRCRPQWVKDRGQFIPHAATWLNGRRWEDVEPPPSAETFETPRERAARERVFRMTGGLLGAAPQGTKNDYIDAEHSNFPALG